jgi:hypothetical protein
MIAEALTPLLPFRQFITYALRQKENGKTDKLPTDYKTGRVADAHNPAIWTDYDTAFAKGGGKVGFVFTDKDPFWFLDIDDCLLPSGEWSPLAVELIGYLPWAAVEVSLSGKGLHLFGTGTMPKHKTRSAVQPGLELYHTLRFVALGSGWSGGNASTDCSAGLIKVVDKYFARLPGEQEETPDWSAAPCVGWNGPLDDDDLIRRMRNSKSAAGVFGSRATADQLWMADATSLGAAYPATDRPYDASTADAALAQHLAFWTGKDCERMKRIMMRSQLSRDKWDRDDYLRRTILQAVAKQVDVLSDKPPATPTMTTAPEDLVGHTIMFPQTQKAVFDGCCYVADINKIIVPGGHCYNKEQFDAMNGGWLFVMNPDNTKSVSSAWECFTRSQAVRFPRVHSSAFKPHMRPGEIWTEGGDQYVNSYWPLTTPRVAGNPGPFLTHLAAMLPDQKDQEIILAYMAAVVQHKGIKFQWCPLIQGSRGNGKTLLSRCLIEAIGRKHCHSPAASEITDKFNDWIENKVFIAVEDIYVPKERKEVVEILKPMITSDWQEIQGKGRDKKSRHVCANFMLNSNHKDAIRTSRDNRGLAVFYCAQQTVDDLALCGMSGQYFPNLYNWLRREGYAIVHDYLAAYAIPDALNPAGACHRAPITSTTEEVLRNSKGSIEQEIEAAVMEDRIGFRGGWVSGNYLELLVKDLGAFHRVARNKRAEILRDAGYIPHPGLRSGQPSNPVQPDGKKPVLYIKATSPLVGLKGIEASKAYSQAQLEPSHLKLAV